MKIFDSVKIIKYLMKCCHIDDLVRTAYMKYSEEEDVLIAKGIDESHGSMYIIKYKPKTLEAYAGNEFWSDIESFMKKIKVIKSGDIEVNFLNDIISVKGEKSRFSMKTCLKRLCDTSVWNVKFDIVEGKLVSGHQDIIEINDVDTNTIKSAIEARATFIHPSNFVVSVSKDGIVGIEIKEIETGKKNQQDFYQDDFYFELARTDPLETEIENTYMKGFSQIFSCLNDDITLWLVDKGPLFAYKEIKRKNTNDIFLRILFVTMPYLEEPEENDKTDGLDFDSNSEFLEETTNEIDIDNEDE